MDDNIDEQLDRALRKTWSSRRILLRRLLRSRDEPNTGHDPGMPRQLILDITPEQFTILCILESYGHGVTVKEITESIEMPHANVTRTLDRLEKKGLIRRSAGHKDRRQVIVKLTLEGTKEARRFAEVNRRLFETMWNKYDYQEKLHLLKLLSR
jgi:DNA-binding MarR family transcriptional regulator